MLAKVVVVCPGMANVELLHHGEADGVNDLAGTHLFPLSRTDNAHGAGIEAIERSQSDVAAKPIQEKGVCLSDDKIGRVKVAAISCEPSRGASGKDVIVVALIGEHIEGGRISKTRSLMDVWMRGGL